ncbi:hypothetical protein AQJ30_22640 [Streptomyces longwoodensis]|uniref:Uncharacterized protein n=1 Tax=Streptomyces longwoodensis TaxID=68231 RepID=A0A101QUX4_9ACTN|nr:hypothetical protein AQJ30_22640 [Streptomyces longwoodensis]
MATFVREGSMGPSKGAFSTIAIDDDHPMDARFGELSVKLTQQRGVEGRPVAPVVIRLSIDSTHAHARYRGDRSQPAQDDFLAVPAMRRTVSAT